MLGVLWNGLVLTFAGRALAFFTAETFVLLRKHARD
jgi:hypothetical protein